MPCGRLLRNLQIKKKKDMEGSTNVKIMATIRDTNSRKPDWNRLNRAAHLVLRNKKFAGRSS